MATVTRRKAAKKAAKSRSAPAPEPAHVPELPPLEMSGEHHRKLPQLAVVILPGSDGQAEVVNVGTLAQCEQVAAIWQEQGVRADAVPAQYLIGGRVVDGYVDHQAEMITRICSLPGDLADFVDSMGYMPDLTVEELRKHAETAKALTKANPPFEVRYSPAICDGKGPGDTFPGHGCHYRVSLSSVGDEGLEAFFSIDTRKGDLQRQVYAGLAKLQAKFNRLIANAKGGA